MRTDASLKLRRGTLWTDRDSSCVECFRGKLIELYGEEAGRHVRYAEAFEVCEYGRRPTPDELRKLFPFVPPKK